MSHTKRSAAFAEKIEAIAVRLNRNVWPDLTPEDKRSTLDELLILLYDNTTDSPCIVKAGEAEPIFVLRASDITADSLVSKWAETLRTQIANMDLDEEHAKQLFAKHNDALACAAEMRAFPNRKRPD